MGFPRDLPNLLAFEASGGNSRPNGIANSYYARHSRGELPPTY